MITQKMTMKSAMMSTQIGKTVDFFPNWPYNTYQQGAEMTGLDFSELRIGRMFHLNGCDYIKSSTRTARMLSNGRVFYIGRAEYIHPIAY